MRLEIFGETNIGQKRQENQDRFAFSESEGWALVVDGMGGHPNGGQAAQTVADHFTMASVDPSLIEAWSEEWSFICSPELLFELAEDKIKSDWFKENPDSMAGKFSSYGGLPGAVGTFLSLNDGYIVISHVGDTRGYLHSEDSVQLITEDHSYPEGSLRNCIAGDIGKVEVQEFSLPAIVGQTFILCSDGLSGMFGENHLGIINEAIEKMRGHGLDQLCHYLVDKANELGGHDNITVVAVKVVK